MRRPGVRGRRGIGPLAVVAVAAFSLVACGPRGDRTPAVIPAQPAAGAVATDQSVPGSTAARQGTAALGDHATDAGQAVSTTEPVVAGPSGPRTGPTVDAVPRVDGDLDAASEDLDQILQDIDRTLAAADATERSARANGE